MSWKAKRLLGMALGCGGILVLLTSGGITGQGIREGLTLCGDVVIPALFPMMVAANFLARSGGADLLSRLLAPVLSPLLRLPKAACATVVLSFLSGYPTGAALVTRLRQEGRIDGATARRMTDFCINGGPGMILLAVGKGMLGSWQAGWILLICHLCASLLIGAVGARWAPRPKDAPFPPSNAEGIASAFVNATADACGQILTLSGFVLLFSGLAALTPPAWQVALPILEVTRGTLALAQAGCPLPVMAAALGFGGLSVQFQALSQCRGGVSFARIFAARTLHAGVSAALCALAVRLFPRAVETAAGSAPLFGQRPSLIPCAVGMLLTAATMLATAAEKNGSSLSKRNVVE